MTFDQAVREIENVFPSSQTVYEYGFNFEKLDFSLWEDRLPNPYKPPEGLPFFKILVPTVDTFRNDFLLKCLNQKYFHSLLVGATGTGAVGHIIGIRLELSFYGRPELSLSRLRLTSSAVHLRS